MDVSRRTELLIKSAQQPSVVFVCGTASGLLTFKPGPHDKPIILLFTNHFSARDYLRTTGVEGEARHMMIDALPKAARGWMQTGADLFGLNRCPRCGAMNGVSLTVLHDRSSFLKVWAVCKAMQWFQGESKVREFFQFQHSSSPRARAALETIRDHIDCSSPYVHELIAFFARMDGDEAARLSSIERLREFAPQFAEWDSRWNGPLLPKSLATAVLGLATAFRVEIKPAV